MTRDLLYTAIGIAVFYSLYYAAREGLTFFKLRDPAADAHLVVLINAALSFLFLLLTFSNLITALAALFLSEDLELILASPISTWRLFIGKSIEVFSASSWVLLLLAAPALLALLIVYKPPIAAALLIISAIALLLLIPTLISIAVVPLACLLFPFAGVKIGAPLAATCFVLLLYLAATFSSAPIARDNLEQLFLAFDGITSMQSPLSPILAAASLSSNLLLGESSGVAVGIAALMLSVGAAAAAAYLVMSRAYFTAISAVRARRRTPSFKSLMPRSAFDLLTPFLAQSTRAVVRKEFKEFIRDPHQLLQVFFLLLLCFVYLFHLGRIQEIEKTSPSAELVWKLVLTLMNIAMGCFLVIAAGTRFVYPSISLEGRSRWILQSAPLHLKQLMRAKLAFWSAPIAAIAAVFLCSGAMAIQADLDLLVLTFFSVIFICYGVVGLAIVFGARFSNFDWQNSSQLTANLGSVAYMAGGTLLVIASLVPVALIALVCEVDRRTRSVPAYEWYAAYLCGLAAIMLINKIAVSLGIRSGEKSLGRVLFES